MATQIIPDFDLPVDRENTDAAKYDVRTQVFGNENVQPLWVADMDLPAPPFLQDALSKRIAHPCYGYTVQSKALKQSVQWWMEKEHEVMVDPGSILFSPSLSYGVARSSTTGTDSPAAPLIIHLLLSFNSCAISS